MGGLTFFYLRFQLLSFAFLTFSSNFQHVLDPTLSTFSSNFQQVIAATLLICSSNIQHVLDATLSTFSSNFQRASAATLITFSSNFQLIRNMFVTGAHYTPSNRGYYQILSLHRKLSDTQNTVPSATSTTFITFITWKFGQGPKSKSTENHQSPRMSPLNLIGHRDV